jgi:hypothetical protein
MPRVPKEARKTRWPQSRKELFAHARRKRVRAKDSWEAADPYFSIPRGRGVPSNPDAVDMFRSVPCYPNAITTFKYRRYIEVKKTYLLKIVTDLSSLKLAMLFFWACPRGGAGTTHQRGEKPAPPEWGI